MYGPIFLSKNNTLCQDGFKILWVWLWALTSESDLTGLSISKCFQVQVQQVYENSLVLGWVFGFNGFSAQKSAYNAHFPIIQDFGFWLFYISGSFGLDLQNFQTLRVRVFQVCKNYLISGKAWLKLRSNWNSLKNINSVLKFGSVKL